MVSFLLVLFIRSFYFSLADAQGESSSATGAGTTEISILDLFRKGELKGDTPLPDGKGTAFGELRACGVCTTKYSVFKEFADHLRTEHNMSFRMYLNVYDGNDFSFCNACNNRIFSTSYDLVCHVYGEHEEGHKYPVELVAKFENQFVYYEKFVKCNAFTVQEWNRVMTMKK